MRLTRILFQKVLPTNMKRWPKPSFRQPMQGRPSDQDHGMTSWETWMGEIDEEETNELGQTVPVRDKVPEIMVPDLTNCSLKPYVTYHVEKHYEPPMSSKDLFDMFYAPQIEADLTGVKLENVPDSMDKPSILNRVKGLFKSEEKKES